MCSEAVDWNEDRTGFREFLVLRAETYRPARLFEDEPSTRWIDGIVCPSGKMGYTNRILAAGTPLDFSLSPNQPGQVEFDGDVVLPTLYDLSNGFPDTWMSLTPKEMVTQRPGIGRASGTVVVGGLGLGWFLKKVHDRPEVDRVILVEHSQDLLDWYGEELCRSLAKVTDVIRGDVYEQIGRFGVRAKHLLDIWKDYGECLLDEQFLWHRRHFKHVWGWGEEVAKPRRDGTEDRTKLRSLRKSS